MIGNPLRTIHPVLVSTAIHRVRTSRPSQLLQTFLAAVAFGGATADAQDRAAAPSLSVLAGLVTPEPFFDRGPEGVRLGVQVEPLRGHVWRLVLGADLWAFGIGCNAIVGSPCDESGVSLDAAGAWHPLGVRAPQSPYLAAGIGILRGPNREFAALPSLRAGFDLGAHRPVGLRLEARFEPHVRRQVVNSEGDRKWRAERSLALQVGLRIRLGKS